LSANEITGVAGLLKAGDYVDVFVTFDQQAVGDHASRLLLQNALVLAVNRDSASIPEKENPSQKEAAKETVGFKITTVTLAVSPEDVVKVTLSEEKGKVRFALRPYIPEDGKTAEKTVTPKDIVGVHTSPGQTGSTESKPGGTTSSGGGSDPTEKKKDNPFGVAVIRGTKVE
jgi:pilus assembly protein CpaB